MICLPTAHTHTHGWRENLLNMHFTFPRRASALRLPATCDRCPGGSHRSKAVATLVGRCGRKTSKHTAALLSIQSTSSPEKDSFRSRRRRRQSRCTTLHHRRAGSLRSVPEKRRLLMHVLVAGRSSIYLRSWCRFFHCQNPCHWWPSVCLARPQDAPGLVPALAGGYDGRHSNDVHFNFTKPGGQVHR